MNKMEIGRAYMFTRGDDYIIATLHRRAAGGGEFRTRRDYRFFAAIEPVQAIGGTYEQATATFGGLSYTATAYTERE